MSKKCDNKEDSIFASETHTTPAKKKTDKNHGQNQCQTQSVSKMNYYSCHKKGHYAKNYTKSKNQLPFGQPPRWWLQAWTLA